jgi:general stress protein 26
MNETVPDQQKSVPLGNFAVRWIMPTESLLLPVSVEAFSHLAEFIRSNQVAMFTMVTSDGTLHSRPLLTRQVDQDGPALWFFLASHFLKTEEWLHGREVALSYVSADQTGCYSVSGRALVVHDKAKAEELWTPGDATRFPTSVDDPRLVLLRVEVEAVQYWDSP